jgi:methionine-rich copper-binding protein CopC
MSIRTLLLTAVLLVAGLASAEAHALLREAKPAVGSTITTTPTEVSIVFSEGVEPKFSSIEVRDSTGSRMDNADPHNGPDGKTQLIVGLLPLRPGVYTVRWSAISVDTHHTTGRFTFTLEGP